MTNKDEQIGFHKGALTTLTKERMEFVKMIQVVEELMKAHINALKELGVDLEKEAQEALDKLEKEKSSRLDEKL